MAGEERDDSVDRLLDLFVYAPIGLLSTGGDQIDELAAKGRERAAVARTLGAFALAGVDQRITASVSDLESMAREFLRIVVESAGPVARREPTASDPTTGDPTGRADIDDVIAGYDDLTAKEVIARLAALDDASLARVESHERSHRNRSTVLARIRRLRG